MRKKIDLVYLVYTLLIPVVLVLAICYMIYFAAKSELVVNQEREVREKAVELREFNEVTGRTFTYEQMIKVKETRKAMIRAEEERIEKIKRVWK